MAVETGTSKSSTCSLIIVNDAWISRRLLLVCAQEMYMNDLLNEHASSLANGMHESGSSINVEHLLSEVSTSNPSLYLLGGNRNGVE